MIHMIQMYTLDAGIKLLRFMKMMIRVMLTMIITMFYGKGAIQIFRND